MIPPRSCYYHEMSSVEEYFYIIHNLVCVHFLMFNSFRNAIIVENLATAKAIIGLPSVRIKVQS